MSGLPSITVVGTVVADPDLKFLSSGAAVSNFSVAANERKPDGNGGWTDGSATFVRCAAWKDMAEHVASSLHRGDRVIVLGRLRQREWEKDGEKRTSFELDVDEVGPSLRWAEADVRKVRSGDAGRRSGGGGGRSERGSAPSSDPWGDVPPPDSELPPF